MPQFFPWLDRLALAALPFFGRLFAGIAFPLAKQKMRRESSRVILPAEDPLLEPHLHRRREAGLRVNVNILGEALLGEDEPASPQCLLNALAKRVPSIEPALRSYTQHAHDEFHAEHDHLRLLGQDNLRRYRPIHRLCICLHEDDSDHEIAARLGAAIAIGCTASITGPGAEEWSEFAEVVAGPDPNQFDRLRYAAPSRVPEAIRRVANEACVYIADTPVLNEGRLELLWYTEEQSLSHDYHRYGNLGARANEKRNGPV